MTRRNMKLNPYVAAHHEFQSLQDLINRIDLLRERQVASIRVLDSRFFSLTGLITGEVHQRILQSGSEMLSTLRYDVQQGLDIQHKPGDRRNSQGKPVSSCLPDHFKRFPIHQRDPRRIPTCGWE